MQLDVQAGHRLGICTFLCSLGHQQIFWASALFLGHQRIVTSAILIAPNHCGAIWSSDKVIWLELETAGLSSGRICQVVGEGGEGHEEGGEGQTMCAEEIKGRTDGGWGGEGDGRVQGV